MSTSVRASGIALIVVVGLLNFHVPHFLLEPSRNGGTATYLLEVGLLANALGAVIAALGIALGRRWGWLLGVVVAVVSVALYVVQETVGLPGLPKMWLEPSRLLALLVEVSFLVLAGRQLTGSIR
jgi:nicotinamide riboside transporter PnuC